MMYKHHEDTLKKAEDNYLYVPPVTLAVCALFMTICSIAALLATIYVAFETPGINMIIYITVDIMCISCAIYLTRIFIVSRNIIGKIKSCSKEEESDFLEINCIKIYAPYTISQRGSHIRRSPGFYIVTETGEKYLFISAPRINFDEFEDKSEKLLGTLYVRRYKGTNLLCEIKKEI